MPSADGRLSQVRRGSGAAHRSGARAARPGVGSPDRTVRAMPTAAARCSDPARRGSVLVQRLSPGPEDYFVLKPKHSGFFHTPLELLLENLGTEVVVLCGFATNSCVTFTAHDAHMRGFRVVVPSDTTAANSGQIAVDALRQLELTVHAVTAESSTVDLACSA